MNMLLTSTYYLFVPKQEDIEKELSKVSRPSRGPGVSQNIMVL